LGERARLLLLKLSVNDFLLAKPSAYWKPSERWRALPSARGKGHFVTPPTALLPKVPIRVNPFVAEPSVPVIVPKIFDGARWRMTVKIGVVLYLYVIIAFHGNLLFGERLE
jgi:hypothetical protein